MSDCLLKNMEPMEGRAFHAGDVVLLRLVYPATDKHMQHLSEVFKDVEKRTGLKFIVLDSTIEVVEPTVVDL